MHSPPDEKTLAQRGTLESPYKATGLPLFSKLLQSKKPEDLPMQQVTQISFVQQRAASPRSQLKTVLNYGGGEDNVLGALRDQAGRESALRQSSNHKRYLLQVEEILDVREGKDGKYYLIKWKGFPSAYNSWEAVSNLRDYQDLLIDFNKKKGLLPHKKPKKAKNDAPYLPKKANTPNIDSEEESASKVKERPTRRCVKNALKRRAYNDEEQEKFGRFKSQFPPWIDVANEVDNELPPLDFRYIEKSFFGSCIDKDALKRQMDLMGCKCKTCKPSHSKDCICTIHTQQQFPYDRHGKLRLPSGIGIFECNSLCECGIDCINRVVQRGSNVNLRLFKTTNRGWGVEATQSIGKGAFIAEYVGEIITNEEAERRHSAKGQPGHTYLFDLDYLGGREEDSVFSIDATHCGNISRFFNHSCDSNMSVHSVFINTWDMRLHRLAFFASRHISKGEELTFDYFGSTDLPSTSSDEDEDAGSSQQTSSQIPPNTLECLCKSVNCRKYIPL